MPHASLKCCSMCRMEHSWKGFAFQERLYSTWRYYFQPLINLICNCHLLAIVQVLFQSGIIDYSVLDGPQRKEAKLLCKKIISFFSVLSLNQEQLQSGNASAITQDLLVLVTGLAHYLKALIRGALMIALRLERTYSSITAVNDFLGKLSELADPNKIEQNDAFGDAKASDLCEKCRVTLEEPCIRHSPTRGIHRWHFKCFSCKKCARKIDRDQFDRALYIERNLSLYCSKECAIAANEPSALTDSPGGFILTSQLDQYIFLLRVAQQRLIHILKVKGIS